MWWKYLHSTVCAPVKPSDYCHTRRVTAVWTDAKKWLYCLLNQHFKIEDGCTTLHIISLWCTKSGTNWILKIDQWDEELISSPFSEWASWCQSHCPPGFIRSDSSSCSGQYLFPAYRIEEFTLKHTNRTQLELLAALNWVIMTAFLSSCTVITPSVFSVSERCFYGTWSICDLLKIQ